MKKKKAFTLLEIMIVIFLIGIIGGIITYNMKGTLEKGKAFKTKQARIRLRDLLELEIAKGADAEELEKNPERFLKNAGVVKNVNNLMKDGWKERFEIKVDSGRVIVISKRLIDYNSKREKYEIEDDEEDDDNN